MAFRSFRLTNGFIFYFQIARKTCNYGYITVRILNLKSKQFHQMISFKRSLRYCKNNKGHCPVAFAFISPIYTSWNCFLFLRVALKVLVLKGRSVISSGTHFFMIKLHLMLDFKKTHPHNFSSHFSKFINFFPSLVSLLQILRSVNLFLCLPYCNKKSKLWLFVIIKYLECICKQSLTWKD